MGVPKGSPKAGGRQKGTPNRKTTLLEDLCKKKKIHPFEALLKLCTHADPAIQLGAVKEACSYLYPKRKALEISEDRENPLGASSEAEALEKMRLQVRMLREERFGK